MKFTLNWLKEHLDTQASVAEIVTALTGLGLEVEGVEDKAAALRDFIVVEVRKADQHPNADRLRVCEVDTGNEVVQVVCGAPNARAGMKGVFARSGLVVPGTGLHLKPSTIRGVASNGMLCSMREMGLSDEHEGIIELPADAPVGRPFAETLGLDDPVIEIKLTPNRQDCLGVHGIARDLAAKGLGKLKPLETSAVAGKFASPVGVHLKFADGDTRPCPLFLGRYVRGVKNGPSPQWLQDRLRAIGLRPISTLVDITNFITFDLGRPLHVFDADRLQGDIHVRLARPGESLPALDGKTYALDGEICAVCDDNGPVGLGGVMGGESTGVTEQTVNVYIEAALFDPLRTAATGRRLGINSDARYRFERGVDPAFVATGMEIATRMVMELCGGEPSHVVAAGAEPAWRREIAYDPAMCRKLGGLDVPAAEQHDILTRLGFGVKAAGASFVVTPPSWRSDIDGPADFVEEVTRIKGYDLIPSEPLPRRPVVAKPAVTAKQRRARIARRLLAARGLYECMTYSFLPRAHAKLFGGGADELVLANPIAADLDTMRPSILPALLAAAGRNQARGFLDLALFEVGPQYAGDSGNAQSLAASGVRIGQTGPRHWAERPRGVDLYDVKADAAALLATFGLNPETMPVSTDAPGWFHPGRSGQFRIGAKSVVARFGELHPAILAAFDLRGPVVAFELDLDQLPAPKQKATRTRPPLDVSDLQPVERDFAFIVDAAVPAEALVKAAKGADRALIAAVTVFDIYQGKGVPEGRKSMALSVRLEPAEKTMTDAEIEAVAAKIVAAVVKATGGTLRG